MRDFARLSPGQKKLFFDAAASEVGLPTHIIEKDFWVCWLLDLLFSLDEIKDHLTFKGGTSLSKVYDTIRRFSEDVDISVEKSYLGFEGDKNPSSTESNKKAKKLIEELGDACKGFVQKKLREELKNYIQEEFSQEPWPYQIDRDWSLEVDDDDKDGQTLLFYYPTESNQVSSYVRPSVKIEVGARADHWPVEMRKISSYVAQGTPQGIANKECEIKVLSIERTFWEKATILHRFANFPLDKKVPIRQSRHFYDTYCLLISDAKEKALEKIDLLEKVSEHKKLYFRSSWADYESAKNPKTLKLVPQEEILNAMKNDYKQMSEMFFDEPPKWEDIIQAIKGFEDLLKELE